MSNSTLSPVVEGKEGEWNMSDDAKILMTASCWMLRISCPIFVLLGTFGSVMTIIFCGRLKSQPGTAVYLKALALSDLAVLYFDLFLQTWLAVQVNFRITELHEVFCILSPYIAQVSSALSSWFLVILTAQRACSVVFPLRINILCTNRRSVFVVCAITGIISLAYLHLFYPLITEGSSEASERACQYRLDYHFYVYAVVSSWADMLIASLVPSALLVLSNSILIKKVLVSLRTARRNLTSAHGDWVGDREKQASSLTATLIVLSVTFLILTIPDRVHVLVFKFLTSVDDDEKFVHCFVYHILRLLHIFNSVVHFYLYCLSGYKFRSEMMKMWLAFRKIKPASSDFNTAKSNGLSTVSSM